MSETNQPLDPAAAARALYGDRYEVAKVTPPVFNDDPARKLWPSLETDEAARQPRAPEAPQSTPPADDTPPTDDVTPLAGINDVDLRGAFDRHVTALGIDAASAEKLYVKMRPALQQSQRNAVQDVVDQWADESRAFYGDGLDDALSFAGRALQAHDAGPELQKLLDDSGLSSHPLMLRFLNSVAKRSRR